jgi:hypothetical protein
MRTLATILAASIAFVAAPRTASADVLTIDTIISVSGLDVASGPTFVVPGAFDASDLFALTADGTVDLAFGNFIANAAGIIVAPATTNTGHHPGQTAPSLGAPHYPYAALLVGNGTLGFFPFFTPSAANGLGDSTPPTLISEPRTLGDIFGAGFAGLSQGDVLQFRVNDINNFDNNGGFRLIPTQVPEPATLLLFGTGLAVEAVRRRNKSRRGA